jgi:hypothetical protein
MTKRIFKQLFIGLLYLLIFSFIIYGFVDYFFIIEPSCSDGVKNGIEEGVDCGLLACGVACEPEIMPLKINFKKTLEVLPKDYDFVAQINNPNSLFGASRANYVLNINTEDGTVFKREGTFFVLPGQTRFLIIPGIKTQSKINDISIEITSIEWQKISNFEQISFPILRKSYQIINNDGVFSEFEAIVFNNSDFSFDKVDVSVVLFDDQDQIIGVNRTDIRTFISKTERGFKVIWPTEIPVSIRQDVEVLTNIFENSNFMRKYGTQEKFQKYY